MLWRRFEILDRSVYYAVLMSISLRNVHVLVPAGSPDAELVAQRCSDAGAIVTTSAVGMAASEIDWSTVALVVLPGQTPGSAELIAAAEERGVPVNNLGRGTEEPQDAGDRDGERPGAGTVTLVGGGPGGEGLITVAGKRAIEGADIIFADHLGPFRLAEEAAERGAELVDVSKIPYGKQVAQEKTNEMLIEAAQQGKKVVRLKGGDPFIFGRGLEEAEACAAAGVPVSVIPGVTSATSAPALAGVSLTHRGWVHDITIVSGHVPPGHEKSLVSWEALAGLTGTLVLIMAVKNAGAIAAELIAKGRSGEQAVTIIESASIDGERVTETTLGSLGETIEEEGIKPPAIIVVGRVSERRIKGLAAAF